jgi:hypothetical protein
MLLLISVLQRRLCRHGIEYAISLAQRMHRFICSIKKKKRKRKEKRGTRRRERKLLLFFLRLFFIRKSKRNEQLVRRKTDANNGEKHEQKENKLDKQTASKYKCASKIVDNTHNSRQDEHVTIP